MAARAPALALLALLAAASARTVNISNAWFLPQEGYPVFYRYFRDRITWFEADAVCQFHHANLVTVETSAQFDATRAYLRELDVTNNVWIGLKRNGPNEPFLWPNYSAVDPSAAAPGGGSWLEQAWRGEGPQCAATDPAADFRWHSLPCGGPAVASFICELPVPAWARAEDGCLLTSLPSLTVTFLPEQGAVELAADCGLEGSRRVACRGQASREEMERQLACEQEATTATPTTSATMATSTTAAAMTTTAAATSESAAASTAEPEQTATTGEDRQRHDTDATSPASTDAPPAATDAFYDSSVSSVTAASDVTASPDDAEVSTATAAEQKRDTAAPEATPPSPPPPPAHDAGGGGGRRPTVTSAETRQTSAAAEVAPATVRPSTARPGSTPLGNATGASTARTPEPEEAEAADPLQYEPEALPHGGRKRRLQRPQERSGSVYPYLLRVLG